MELLSGVMGLAVFVMACAQLKLVAQNETSVESSDNGELSSTSSLSNGSDDVEYRIADWYRKIARSQNREFRNPYDLGWRENLKDFFSIGEAPDRQ
jgi:palmitoyltransferase